MVGHGQSQEHDQGLPGSAEHVPFMVLAGLCADAGHGRDGGIGPGQTSGLHHHA